MNKAREKRRRFTVWLAKMVERHGLTVSRIEREAGLAAWSIGHALARESAMLPRTILVVRPVVEKMCGEKYGGG